MSSNFHLTKFEQAVLSAVRRVPVGRVTTYAALAHAISNPHAARAVGQALNKNPRLVTIPCHRVVRSDGSLGGYRRGQERKKHLLVSEGMSFTPQLRIKNFVALQYHW